MNMCFACGADTKNPTLCDVCESLAMLNIDLALDNLADSDDYGSLVRYDLGEIEELKNVD